MTLLELLKLLRKHLKLVVALPVLCAVFTAAVCWTLLPNTYTADVSMYVLSKSNDKASITNSDLSASQMLTNDVVTLVKGSRVQSDAAKALGMTSFSGYDVKVTSATTTRVVTVSVTGKSAEDVAAVANQLAKTTDDVAQEVMNLESINVIDEASAPASPSGPARMKYVAVALLAGLFVAVAFVVVLDMVNTRVRTPEEVEEMLGLPTIGRIPVIKG